MAHVFVSSLRREPLRSNGLGVPIPPTPKQYVAAFDATRRYCEKRPSLIGRDTMALRLWKEIQLLVQGRPSGDEATAAARWIGYQHLNGF
jgi:hypothetical protein